jgi:Tol biopolymer transport system component
MWRGASALAAVAATASLPVGHEALASPAGRAPLLRPLDPAISPDGNWVAFEAQTRGFHATTGIWVARSDGMGLRLLDHGVGYNPLFSRDGRRVLFMVDAPSGNAWRLVSVARSGGPVRTLVASRGPLSGGPVLSPDGRLVALEGDYYVSTISIFNLASGRLVGALRHAWMTNSGSGPHAGFAWSPDSRSIAFTACLKGFSPNQGACRQGLFVERVDGEGRRRLGHVESSDQLSDLYQLAWFPDGWISYGRTSSSSSSNATTKVREIRADGSGDHALFPGPGLWDWSPDGTRVVQTTGFGQSPSLLLRSRAGRLVARLPNASCINDDHEAPNQFWCGADWAWSPDSKRLVFTAGTPKRDAIVVANSATGRARVLRLGR